MKHRSLFPLALQVLAVLMLAGPFIKAQQAPPTGPPVIEYRVGQVWNYKAPPRAIGSRVIILKIESKDNMGNVIHIRIDNIQVSSCAGTTFITAVEHIAMTEKALRDSTTSLWQEKIELPDSYFDAYKEWEKHGRHIVKLPLQVVFSPPISPLICN